MTENPNGRPEQQYQRLLAQHEKDLRDWSEKLAGSQTAFRYLLYGSIASLAAAYLFSSYVKASLVLAAGLAVVATVLHRVGSVYLQRAAYARDMARINRDGIARRQRAWDSLSEPTVDSVRANLPLSIDLDLFGKASLIQLICTAETERGIDQLADWLVQPSAAQHHDAQHHDSPQHDSPQLEPERLVRRQRACQSLAPLLAWRQELQRRCRLISQSAAQLHQLQQWGGDRSAWNLPTAVRLYLLALRFLVPASVVTLFFSAGVGLSMLAALVAVNIGMTIALSGRVHTHFRRIMVSPDAPSFHSLSETFGHIAGLGELGDLYPETTETCRRAVTDLRRLERILVMESIARNALSVMFVFLPLQLTLLWDLQVYRLASDWREASGSRLKQWFELLGEVEALSSIASLSFEQPTWGFPEVDGTGSDDSITPMFVAEGLGHPLLPDDSRVTNDVTVGPPGTLLLITGSNMGGKSTLLRAIGMNAVLAQAGAPCCCGRLRMTPLRVMTSMRVSDSLSDSTSFFVAQLLTLKRIVDEVKLRQEDPSCAPVMYLFDEILNGTNTTDRRIAVEGLIAYLLRCQTIGAMTTHDLEIATASKYKEAFETYYLSHQLAQSATETDLTFDYKLRRGVSPSSNALALVRMLGLPEG